MIDIDPYLSAGSAIVWVAGVLGAALLILGAVRKMWRAYKDVKTKATAVYDSVVGADAIVDPESGDVLKPATYPIGHRVAAIESWQSTTVDTLQRVTSTLEATHQLEQRFTAWLEQHNREHEKIWDAIETMK